MKARVVYWGFVTLAIIALLVAAIPIAASDLFREPYSPVWPIINRTMARFDYTYNPSGGGVPPRFPYWRTPAEAMLYYRDVTLRTQDDVRLSAWYVPADAPSGRPTILLTHGLLDSKWTMLHLVPWLHDAGYNVLLFDFRGHGGSDRRPTTIGPDEVKDVQSALDWLDAEGVGEQVVGLGMSLGAAALVNTAVADDRLDGLILDSLFANWSDVDYAEGYRFSPDWLVPGVPSPMLLLSQIHVPVLIIHGTADILTHVDHAYRLYDAANEPKDLWVNDSGHAWSAWTYPEQYKQRVLALIRDAISR